MFYFHASLRNILRSSLLISEPIHFDKIFDVLLLDEVKCSHWKCLYLKEVNQDTF